MKFSAKLLMPTLAAMIIINAHQIKGMNINLKPFLQVLHQMAQPGQLLPEISAQIYVHLINLDYTNDDIIRIHQEKIKSIAQQLTSNYNNPEAVLSTIEELQEADSFGQKYLSTLLLKTGLNQANIKLCNITNWRGKNCLQLICDGTLQLKNYLDCIKIMLNVGTKNDTYKLITNTSWLAIDSAWDNARNLDGVFNLFSNWAHNNTVTFFDKRKLIFAQINSNTGRYFAR